jgi:pilus assembly protein CpaB
VSNVRVLALDQKSDSQSTDPKVAQLATLEVTQQQAEKLALAMDMAGPTTANTGSISLVLRSLASSNSASASDIGADKSDAVMDNDVSPVLPQVMRMQRVHIMRGKDMTDSIFQGQK